MNRTNPANLVPLVVVAGIPGYLVEYLLYSAGRALFIPPLSFGIALAAVGVLVVLFARPIYPVARKHPGARVNPFYAARVAVLAKASSIAGAAALGFTIAVLVFVLGRPVLPAVGSLVATVVAVVGAFVLLFGGLVAEWMCRLPPEKDEPEEPAA